MVRRHFQALAVVRLRLRPAPLLRPRRQPIHRDPALTPRPCCVRRLAPLLSVLTELSVMSVLTVLSVLSVLFVLTVLSVLIVLPVLALCSALSISTVSTGTIVHIDRIGRILVIFDVFTDQYAMRWRERAS